MNFVLNIWVYSFYDWETNIQRFLYVIVYFVDDQKKWSVCLCLWKELQGELGEGLQFPKLSEVDDRLFIIGIFGFWPNTSSYGDKIILVLTCELNAKRNVFDFCDHASYCESKTLRKNMFSWRLLFSTSPLDHVGYGVRGLNCTLYVRQKFVNSALRRSFPLSVSKISVIPQLTIQWSNITVSAFAATFLGEGWRTYNVWRLLR